MEKILEALKKLLPENDVAETAKAVKDMLEQAKVELEKEYNTKLEEAYAELSNELSQAEKVAEDGYNEAYTIIGDLRNRLEAQGEEYKSALNDGYEEAYQLLKVEQDKNKNLEVEMYEEYDKKLVEMKEYIVDKVNEFLKVKGNEIYEQAKRDVINDPRMAEHKVTLDKIVKEVSSYLSEDDFANVSNSRLDEVTKKLEEVQGQCKIMEARNIRISNENTKLNETVRQAQKVINEHKEAVDTQKKTEVITEQKERTEKAQKVTGKGQTNVSPEDSVVLREYTAPDDETMRNMLVLAGLKKDE